MMHMNPGGGVPYMHSSRWTFTATTSGIPHSLVGSVTIPHSALAARHRATPPLVRRALTKRPGPPEPDTLCKVSWREDRAEGHGMPFEAPGMLVLLRDMGPESSGGRCMPECDCCGWYGSSDTGEVGCGSCAGSER